MTVKRLLKHAHAAVETVEQAAPRACAPDGCQLEAEALEWRHAHPGSPDAPVEAETDVQALGCCVRLRFPCREGKAMPGVVESFSRASARRPHGSARDSLSPASRICSKSQLSHSPSLTGVTRHLLSSPSGTGGTPSSSAPKRGSGTRVTPRSSSRSLLGSAAARQAVTWLGVPAKMMHREKPRSFSMRTSLPVESWTWRM